MPTISKDTILCISLAQRPGNIGTLLFNAAFAAKKIDYIYKAFPLEPGNLPTALNGIRALGIRGCGLSMPHKIDAVNLVDSLDPIAKKIGAINTIVNHQGRLKGYNTDFYGAQQLLSNVPDIRHKSVVLLGAGGVAKAISAALAKARASQVTIINREPAPARQLASQWNFQSAKWPQHQTMTANLFINATPIGMAPQAAKSPLTAYSIANYSIIMDVITNPIKTQLIQTSTSQKKHVLIGATMALHQATRQFELYTGHPAPIAVMKKHLLNT